MTGPINENESCLYCSNCGDPIKDEAPSGDPAQRKPCPRCGSVARRFGALVSEGIEILEGSRARGLRAGMSRTKGWFIDSLSRWVHQTSRDNAIAHHERVLDRDSDRYTEKVTMRDSGEIIHNMDERLSEHRGHGSDKPKNLPG